MKRRVVFMSENMGSVMKLMHSPLKHEQRRGSNTEVPFLKPSLTFITYKSINIGTQSFQ